MTKKTRGNGTEFRLSTVTGSAGSDRVMALLNG